MKKTKIICSIGPASEPVEVMTQMVKAGMDCARINFSHGGYEEQKDYINAVKKAREEVNMPVALMMDTQGPEIRTGILEKAPIELESHDLFTLVNEELIGNKERVSVSYKQLYKDIKVGSQILIDDGKIELQVKEIKGKDVVCKVTNGGLVRLIVGVSLKK